MLFASGSIGLICITSFISPYRADRAQARAAAQRTGFHEIYIAADLAACEARDPKGLYRKARAGELKEFTGIDAPYEVPAAPELILTTGRETVQASLTSLLNYVTDRLPLRR